MRPNKTLDISADFCPITFVKTKLVLDEMTAGEILEVFLSGKEAVRNVPRSLRQDGHKVQLLEKQGDGIYRMLVEKEGGHE